MRTVAIFLLLLALGGLTGGSVVASSESTIPDWVVTAKSKVNGRVGPGKRYPIRWVYETPFLPFKVLAYKDGWYKVKDYQSDETWVASTMVTSKAQVFLITTLCPFFKKESSTEPYALLGEKALVRIRKCKGYRCEGFIRSYEGWFEPASCGWGPVPGLKS